MEPVDARLGAPASPVGAAGFERWCADNLAGDHHVVAGSGGALVCCRLAVDAALPRRVFGAPAVTPR